MVRPIALLFFIGCVSFQIFTPTARALEPLDECIPPPVDKTDEQMGSFGLIAGNLGLVLVNASRNAQQRAPGWPAVLGLVVGAGSLTYAAAEDPEFSLSLGVAGGFCVATSLYCLANGPDREKPSGSAGGWRARVAPAVIVPQKGRALLGVGVAGGF